MSTFKKFLDENGVKKLARQMVSSENFQIAIETIDQAKVDSQNGMLLDPITVISKDTMDLVMSSEGEMSRMGTTMINTNSETGKVTSVYKIIGNVDDESSSEVVPTIFLLNAGASSSGINMIYPMNPSGSFVVNYLPKTSGTIATIEDITSDETIAAIVEKLGTSTWTGGDY